MGKAANPLDHASQVAGGNPAVNALGIQAFALLSVLVVAGLISAPVPTPATALACGAIAFLLSRTLGQTWWWQAINAAFPLAIFSGLELNLDPRWYFAAFAVLLTLFWGAPRSRVPLFPSSRAAALALAELLPAIPNPRFLDLGSGLGGVQGWLARVRPDGAFEGIESSPLVYLLARLRFRLLGRTRCSVRLADLWNADLSQYDLVYAYLSPAPMPELWRKVRLEMRPGTLFVSNTFGVPGVAADRIIELGDLTRARLHVWRMR